jgi:hypothetical protein
MKRSKNGPSSSHPHPKATNTWAALLYSLGTAEKIQDTKFNLGSSWISWIILPSTDKPQSLASAANFTITALVSTIIFVIPISMAAWKGSRRCGNLPLSAMTASPSLSLIARRIHARCRGYEGGI